MKHPTYESIVAFINQEPEAIYIVQFAPEYSYDHQLVSLRGYMMKGFIVSSDVPYITRFERF